MPAAVARRTRYDTPKWAERFPDTPEGLDAMHSHGEARKLPRHTDPDSIDDPDVRDAFLSQLQDEHEHDAASPTPSSSTPTSGNSSRSSGGFRLPVPASFGSAVFGLVVYAIGVNFVRGGAGGVKQWLSAKFTNGGGVLA